MEGSLEVGKWADFILIDRDVYKIEPQDIWETAVLETWLAGERVFVQDQWVGENLNIITVLLTEAIDVIVILPPRFFSLAGGLCQFGHLRGRDWSTPHHVIVPPGKTLDLLN